MPVLLGMLAGTGYGHGRGTDWPPAQLLLNRGQVRWSLCALDPHPLLKWRRGRCRRPCSSWGNGKRPDLCSLEFSGQHVVLAESMVIVYSHLPTVQEALIFHASDSECLTLASLSYSQISSVTQHCPGLLHKSPLGLCWASYSSCLMVYNPR